MELNVLSAPSPAQIKSSTAVRGVRGAGVESLSLLKPGKPGTLREDPGIPVIADSEIACFLASGSLWWIYALRHDYPAFLLT